MKKIRAEIVFVLLFLFFTVSLVVIMFVTGYSLNHYADTIQQSVEERLMMAAKTASTLVSADDLDAFHSESDLEDADKAQKYDEILTRMRAFADEYDLLYVYYMRLLPGEEGMHQMILDSDESEEQLTLAYTEATDDYVEKAYAGQVSCMTIGDYSEEWYGVIAAYAPVFDNDGNVVAIAGADIGDEAIVAVRNRSATLSLFFTAEVVAVIVLGIIGIVMFRRKADAYQSASIAKSQFLSRMSHEIRTPMNAVIGFCRMANGSDNIVDIKEYLHKITNSSTFLLQLINSILDISKIEAGKMVLNLTPNSPAAIMGSIRDMLAVQAEAKHIDFKFASFGEVPDYVFCDNTYLTQVIVNLVSNAIKFTPENGSVTVTMRHIATKNNKARIVFSVEDTGIGIAPEFLPKVFEAFEQSDGGNSRRYGGTGLGLSIAKLLVEMMGGIISVESTLGKGTTFMFEVGFDIAEGDNAPELISEADTAAVDLTGKTVLVVEDNDINQIIAGNALEELGAAVEFADNGEMGLGMFIKDPAKYDFIFMDIQMPGMDGFECTRRIRACKNKEGKTVPIIAMSANVFREDIEASLESGMDAHIGKPFDIKTIKEGIVKALRRK